MKRVRLAVIGAGVIGKKHIDTINSSQLAELVAICDADPRVRALSSACGAAFYQDCSSMLAQEKLDGVIIATPTDQHAPVGVICAQHSLHMLIEKPISATLAEGRELIGVAKQYGVQVLVGHHRRHNRLVQRAREIVRGGELGRLIAVCVLWTLQKHDEYFAVDWRIKRPGGGPVLTNLIHDIDNLRFICGEIRSVYALTGNMARNHAVEDSASITLQFADGALGSLLLSDATPAPWAYELTSGENPDFPEYEENSYYFLGTKASLAFPRMQLSYYPDATAKGWGHPLSTRQLDVAKNQPLAGQIDHFCRVILGEEAPIITGQDGLDTLAATLAVLESGERSAPVMLSCP